MLTNKLNMTEYELKEGMEEILKIVIFLGVFMPPFLFIPLFIGLGSLTRGIIYKDNALACLGFLSIFLSLIFGIIWILVYIHNFVI